MNDDDHRAFLKQAYERNKAALDRLGEGPSSPQVEIQWTVSALN